MIAILGGTFDPVHNGHLRLALNLKQRVGFEAVHFVPSGIPPHRSQPARSAKERYKMVELALQYTPDVHVNDCETLRKGPSYMVETLMRLRKQWGKQKSVSLILGSDAFAQLNTWYRWQGLFELCHILVVARPGEPPLAELLSPELREQFNDRLRLDSADLHKKAAGLVYVQNFPGLDISATAIRNALAQGENVQHLLPECVLAYIEAHDLYSYKAPPASDKLKAFLQELNAAADPQIAAKLQRFFKTGKGEYSEHDQFLGIYVPTQRTILARHAPLGLGDIAHLLHSPYHEYRMSATLSLIDAYQSGSLPPDSIFSFAWQHRRQFNNWDLVDAYAPKILGRYLHQRAKAPLYQLAYSNELWQQRQALVACLPMIQEHDFEDCLSLVPLFFHSKEDLLHKASGWMLREIGQQDQSVLLEFLRHNADDMPRVMLRTALEKFSSQEQKRFMCPSS